MSGNHPTLERTPSVCRSVLCAYAAIGTLAASATAQAGFKSFDISGGSNITPLSINAQGAVTGYYIDPKASAGSFVRAADGTITTFLVKDAATFAGSINGKGTIAGDYNFNGGYYGFLRKSDGKITTFSAPGAHHHHDNGTLVDALNDTKTITGSFTAQSEQSHGYIRNADASILTFDVPGATGFGTISQTINSSGYVAGIYYASQVNGFVRAPDGTISAFSLGSGAFAIGINTKNDIAGYLTDQNGARHGFLRLSDGSIVSFDPKGAGNGDYQGTYAGAINDKDDIVGTFVDAHNVNHGFLRTADGMITTFDVPGAGTAAYQGTIARSLNGRDHVTGTYIDSNGGYHGFVGRP